MGAGGSTTLLLWSRLAAAAERAGRKAEAHRALEEALDAAQAIPTQRSRENNIDRIKQDLRQIAP